MRVSDEIFLSAVLWTEVELRPGLDVLRRRSRGILPASAAVVAPLSELPPWLPPCCLVGHVGSLVSWCRGSRGGWPRAVGKWRSGNPPPCRWWRSWEGRVVLGRQLWWWRSWEGRWGGKGEVGLEVALPPSPAKYEVRSLSIAVGACRSGRRH